jgi:tRNA pseudouridine13 synthase
MPKPRLLADEGVTLDDFKLGGDETQDGRRPYRVRRSNPSPSSCPRAPTPPKCFTSYSLHELFKDG